MNCEWRACTDEVTKQSVRSGPPKRYCSLGCKRSAAVQRRRDKLKVMSVEYLGRICLDCKLKTEYLGVYDFHHLDPSTKSFGISQNGVTRAWDKMKVELDKCVLLCSNCHRIRRAKNVLM